MIKIVKFKIKKANLKKNHINVKYDQFFENLEKSTACNSIISAIKFQDNEPYKLTCELIKSNNEFITILKAFKTNDKNNFIEIKISESKLKKIIQSIHFDDIIDSFTLKSFIKNFKLFVKNVLIHYIYLFKESNLLKIGIASKPCGALVTRKFIFEFLDCKEASVDIIIIKRGILKLYIINDINKY